MATLSSIIYNAIENTTSNEMFTVRCECMDNISQLIDAAGAAALVQVIP